MICIILRNIDTETVDYELLLFGYLKVCCPLSLYLILSLIHLNRLRAACGTGHLVYLLTPPVIMVRTNLEMHYSGS
jgi:hypothetical protein